MWHLSKQFSKLDIEYININISKQIDKQLTDNKVKLQWIRLSIHLLYSFYIQRITVEKYKGHW